MIIHIHIVSTLGYWPLFGSSNGHAGRRLYHTNGIRFRKSGKPSLYQTIVKNVDSKYNYINRCLRSNYLPTGNQGMGTPPMQTG